MTATAAAQFFFEDVELHGIRETPGMTVTEAHVALYGGVTGDLAPAATAVFVRKCRRSMAPPIRRVVSA